MINKIFIALATLFIFIGCNSSEVEDYIKDKIKYEEGVVDDSGTPDNTPVGDISQQEIDDLLLSHNSARAEVGIDNDLQWDSNLEIAAQVYADKMADEGIWAHDIEGNRENGYGENLYTSTRKKTLKEASDAWIDEKEYYTYGEVGDSSTCEQGKKCGHYTQIIWEDTTRVGCAKSRYKTGKYESWYIVVCKYQIPGNHIGETPY